MSTLMFFHGLESGPHGSKFQALQTAFGVVEAPDFRGLDTIEERYTKAKKLTRGRTDLLLVGSSFGGLLALLLADRHPERIAGYVLCAPALHRAEAVPVQAVPEHVILIHGREDDVVPARHSVAFAEKFKVPLLLVTDNHRLSGSRDLLVGCTRQMRDAIIRDS